MQFSIYNEFVKYFVKYVKVIKVRASINNSISISSFIYKCIIEKVIVYINNAKSYSK